MNRKNIWIADIAAFLREYGPSILIWIAFVAFVVFAASSNREEWQQDGYEDPRQ